MLNIITAPFRAFKWLLGQIVTVVLWPFRKALKALAWAIGLIVQVASNVLKPIGSTIHGLWKSHPYFVALCATAVLAWYSYTFHDPGNQLTFHGADPLKYVAVGFANLFWGVWLGVCHFGNNILLIPQRLDGCPFEENRVGWVIGFLVNLVLALIEAPVWWALNCLPLKEIGIGLFLAAAAFALSNASGGHAPAPKPAGGGHGGGH